MIKEIFENLKEELKKEILNWNFSYNILSDREIKIDWIIINFYIEKDKAIICPFQQIEFDLNENQEKLFLELLIWKWLIYNPKEIAIKAIKEIAKKYNLDLKNL